MPDCAEVSGSRCGPESLHLASATSSPSLCCTWENPDRPGLTTAVRLGGAGPYSTSGKNARNPDGFPFRRYASWTKRFRSRDQAPARIDRCGSANDVGAYAGFFSIARQRRFMCRGVCPACRDAGSTSVRRLVWHGCSPGDPRLRLSSITCRASVRGLCPHAPLRVVFACALRRLRSLQSSAASWSSCRGLGLSCRMRGSVQ